MNLVQKIKPYLKLKIRDGKGGGGFGNIRKYFRISETFKTDIKIQNNLLNLLVCVMFSQRLFYNQKTSIVCYIKALWYINHISNCNNTKHQSWYTTSSGKFM